MEKIEGGVIIVALLVLLQTIGWITMQNGVLTGTVMSIIGGIAGAIFGFAYGWKKD